MDGNLYKIYFWIPLARNPQPAQLLSIGSTDLFGAQFLGERHVGLVPEKIRETTEKPSSGLPLCYWNKTHFGPNPGSQTYK